MGGNEQYKGFLAALTAFTFWGMVPIFWKQISGVSAMELLGHRIVWAFLTLLLIQGYRKKISLQNINWRPFLLSTALIAGNWLLFVWAVNNDYIIEVSIGYFLNPLLNVFLGYLILRETLSPRQWVSIGFAGIGIAILLVGSAGNLFVSLALAGSFGVYGLVRKRISVSAEEGLLIETGLCTAPLILLAFLFSDQVVFFELTPWMKFLCFLTGWVTLFPLFLFNYSVQRLEYKTVGMFQYIAPILQLVVAVSIYAEPLGSVKMAALAFIWCGLIIYVTSLFNRTSTS